MKLFFAVMVVFLLAFSGLAAGLLFKREGLRGGCGSGTRHDPDRGCRCGGTQPEVRVLKVVRQTKTGQPRH
jgi:hypothetical protein